MIFFAIYTFVFMKYLKLFVILLICSGCGFKPLYYAGGNNTVLSKFYYDGTYRNEKYPRATFFLNNELEKLFDNKAKVEPKFLLKIEYEVDKKDYLIQDNSIANRKKIQIVLNYSVTDYNDNKILISGKLTDFDSFAITESPYADYVAEEELVIRVLLSLVQELRLQLISKLSKE
jgi:hypothetical protein